MSKLIILIIFISISVLYLSEIDAQTFRLMRPVKDNIQANGSYLYGEPNFQNPSLAHTGVDYSIVYDTVFSASDGIVYFVGYNPNDTINGYEPNGAGNFIIIKSQWNNKNIYLLYFHLKKPLVATNQNVVSGQPIAISGNTGNSTGPHLHFEIRMDYPDYSTQRSRRNPELWCGMKNTGAVYGKIPNASNSTRVDIFPDPKPRPPYTTFSYALTYNFNDPYIGSDDLYQENYTIGDVKPGIYTIIALNGAYRRLVNVQAGQIVNADATISSVDNEKKLDFELYQNYPNPFNSVTCIKVIVPLNYIPEDLKLEIFDILGRKIFESERLKSGLNEIYFDANQSEINLSSGVLIYKLNSSNFDHYKKMIYLK